MRKARKIKILNDLKADLKKDVDVFMCNCLLFRERNNLITKDERNEVLEELWKDVSFKMLTPNASRYFDIREPYHGVWYPMQSMRLRYNNINRTIKRLQSLEVRK